MYRKAATSTEHAAPSWLATPRNECDEWKKKFGLWFKGGEPRAAHRGSKRKTTVTVSNVGRHLGRQCSKVTGKSREKDRENKLIAV